VVTAVAGDAVTGVVVATDGWPAPEEHEAARTRAAMRRGVFTTT
jgi:hypothetical protein